MTKYSLRPAWDSNSTVTSNENARVVRQCSLKNHYKDMAFKHHLKGNPLKCKRVSVVDSVKKQLSFGFQDQLALIRKFVAGAIIEFESLAPLSSSVAYSTSTY